MREPTGAYVNAKILAHGVVPLVNRAGNHITFYPRGKLPGYVVDYLEMHDGLRSRLLRDFLVALGRGPVN